MVMEDKNKTHSNENLTVTIEIHPEANLSKPKNI